MATRTKGKSQPEMPTKTLIADAIRSIYKENAMDTDAFSFAFMNQQSAITAAMNANATTSTDKENAMTAIIDTTTATAATENTKETAMQNATADTTKDIAMQNATTTTAAATETAAQTFPSLREAMIAKGLAKPVVEPVQTSDVETAPETDAETVFWNAVEKYHGMREDAPRSFAKAVADGEVSQDVLNEIARRDAIVAQNSMFEAAENEAEAEDETESDAPSSLDDLASSAEDSLYELIQNARSIALENQKLMSQLEALAAKNAALELENAALKAQVAEQQDALASKDALIDELRGSINEQSEEIVSKANLIAVLQQQIEANDLALKQKSADEATALEMARLAGDEAAMLKAAITQRDAEANALKAAVHTASNDAMAWAKAAHDAAAKAAVLQEKLQNIAKMLS